MTLLAGAVAVFVDITERRRWQDELRRNAEFRDRLIGIVSHDLRSPLGAITLAAQVLSAPRRHRSRSASIAGWTARS